MPFMQIITQKGPFIEIESTLDSFDSICLPAEDAQEALNEAMSKLRLSPDGNQIVAQVRQGWFCRQSANGYMDCTEWVGPEETEEAAIKSYCNMHDICEHCHEQCWESEEGDCQERDDNKPEPEPESKPSCDQCNAMMIQGVFCHETGCPNAKKKGGIN